MVDRSASPFWDGARCAVCRAPWHATRHPCNAPCWWLALCAPRATRQELPFQGLSGTWKELWPVAQRWDCISAVLAASRRSVAKGLDRWGRLARPKRPRGTGSVSQYTSRSLWRGGRTPSSQDKPPRRATMLKRSGIDTLNGTEQVNRAILNTSLPASLPFSSLSWFLWWYFSLSLCCLLAPVVGRTCRLNADFGR